MPRSLAEWRRVLRRGLWLQVGAVAGQLLLFATAFRRSPRRALLGLGLMYGASVLWAREALRDG